MSKKKDKPKFRKLLLAILILLVVWAGLIEPNLLMTNNVNLKIPNWHDEHKDLKFVVISDLHIGCNGGSIKRLKHVVDETNKQKPDMVLILGDYAADSIEIMSVDKEHITSQLKRIKAPLGVVSVLGNHDYYPDIVRKILKNADINLLEDEVLKVRHKGKSFYIAGIKDTWHYHLDLDRINRNIPDNKPAIMLAHNPDAFPEFPTKYGLTLSGHNHGGVIYIPFLGGLIVPSKYNQKYVRGHVIENGKQLLVSTGIGTNTFIRLNTVPEILVLKLSRLDNKSEIKDTPQKPFMDLNLYNFVNTLFRPIQQAFYNNG